MILFYSFCCGHSENYILYRYAKKSKSNTTNVCYSKLSYQSFKCLKLFDWKTAKILLLLLVIMKHYPQVVVNIQLTYAGLVVITLTLTRYKFYKMEA